MKRRELRTGLAATALARGCTSQTSSRVQTSQPRYSSPVPLPSPATTDTISLEKAIRKRQSLRAFRPDPLPINTIGQLLWAGQGITSPDGKRAAPSAGALYPLELYVVTPKQVMHYLPDGHRAETRAASDLRPGLKAAAVGQSTVGAAPAVIAVAAVPRIAVIGRGARLCADVGT
jgi:Nitroreductase family